MEVSGHIYEVPPGPARPLRELRARAVGHARKGPSTQVQGQLWKGTLMSEQQGPRTPTRLGPPQQPLPGLLCDTFHEAV